MPTRITLPSLIALLLMPLALSAQDMEWPRKSPAATAAYTLGYTQIEARYSSPAVDGREIWGALVPYGEVWRAGANEATTIAFSTDVEIEGKPLPAGRYAFFLIPRKEGAWTAIFNKEADQWGPYRYDPAQDALRVEVEARFSKAAADEHLAYSVIVQDADNGYLRLAWEHLRLYLRIKVNTVDKAMAAFRKALETAPQEQKGGLQLQAAEFLLWAGQPEAALPHAEQAVTLEPSSHSYWAKARILAGQGDFKGALDAAQKARELSQDNEQDTFFKRAEPAFRTMIESWKQQQ